MTLQSKPCRVETELQIHRHGLALGQAGRRHCCPLLSPACTFPWSRLHASQVICPREKQLLPGRPRLYLSNRCRLGLLLEVRSALAADIWCQDTPSSWSWSLVRGEAGGRLHWTSPAWVHAQASLHLLPVGKLCPFINL